MSFMYSNRSTDLSIVKENIWLNNNVKDDYHIKVNDKKYWDITFTEEALQSAKSPMFERKAEVSSKAKCLDIFSWYRKEEYSGYQVTTEYE